MYESSPRPSRVKLPNMDVVRHTAQRGVIDLGETSRAAWVVEETAWWYQSRYTHSLCLMMDCNLISARFLWSLLVGSYIMMQFWGLSNSIKVLSKTLYCQAQSRLYLMVPSQIILCQQLHYYNPKPKAYFKCNIVLKESPYLCGI